jgi:hypothetical protein
MFAPKDPRKQYSEELNKQFGDIGRFLSEPVLRKKLDVGFCGYFDENRSWHRIADLANPTALKDKCFTTFEADLADRDEDDNITWGPMMTSSVRDTKFGADLQVTVPAGGVPIAPGFTFNLASGETFGAVLVTEPPIEKVQINLPESYWKEWLQQNQALISQHYKREMEKFGISFITTIYLTKRAYISFLNSHESSKEIGFHVEAGNIVKVDPHWKSSSTSTAAGWQTYESQVSP